MGNTQVTSLHPVRVDGDLRAPVTVRNESGVTVYYRNQEAVSSTENNGNLTEHQEVTVTSATWFITAAQTDCEIRTFAAEPEVGQIGTGSLANLSVTTGKLAAEAVTFPKTTVPGAPAVPGTESLTAVLGTAGVPGIAVARYTAKAEASAKVKVKHGLSTEYVQVRAYTTATKKPSEVLLDGSAAAGAIAKIKVESANEILLTLAAGEPSAKEEFLYVIIGG